MCFLLGIWIRISIFLLTLPKFLLKSHVSTIFQLKINFCLIFVYIFNMFKILRSCLHYDVKMKSHADDTYFGINKKRRLITMHCSKHKGIEYLLQKIQRGLQRRRTCYRKTSGGSGLKMIAQNSTHIVSSFSLKRRKILKLQPDISYILLKICQFLSLVGIMFQKRDLFQDIQKIWS